VILLSSSTQILCQYFQIGHGHFVFPVRNHFDASRNVTHSIDKVSSNIPGLGVKVKWYLCLCTKPLRCIGEWK